MTKDLKERLGFESKRLILYFSARIRVKSKVFNAPCKHYALNYSYMLVDMLCKVRVKDLVDIDISREILDEDI